MKPLNPVSEVGFELRKIQKLSVDLYLARKINSSHVDDIKTKLDSSINCIMYWMNKAHNE